MDTSLPHSKLNLLTSWLESSSPNRLLILEDGATGSISPLAGWLENVAESPSYEVISIFVGPQNELFLERNILAKIYRLRRPDDDLDYPSTISLRELRDHGRCGLPHVTSEQTRLVALDRVNWGEKSFRENLEYLLGGIGQEHKVVLSIRLEAGHEPNVAEWCERLGWRAEEMLCLRLPASLDGELPPKEQAQHWIDTWFAAEAHGAGRITDVLDVLDVLAATLRPMRVEEMATILDINPSDIRISLNLVPKRAVRTGDNERYAFHDEALAHAWADLRSEASARLRERILALGEAVLRSAPRPIVPYVIEHYGALLAEHREPSAQLPLVSEAWANAWSSLNNLLGFEADVERVWSTVRRELLASASAPESQRGATLLTYYRCLQVSGSAVHRVCNLRSTAENRAKALVGIAEELDEPQRTWTREQAVAALLAAPIKAGDPDLLTKLANRFEGDRRDAIVAKILSIYRTNIAEWASSVWLLRAAPLLPAVEWRALCNEVISQLRELSRDDAWALRDALGALPSPSDVAMQLTQAIPVLAQPDRFRFECALAPYLKGEAQKRVVEETLNALQAHYVPVDLGDVESLARSLNAEQLSRLTHALKGNDKNYLGKLAGVCIRALCALGNTSDAESLAGPDVASWPFDWVLALTASLRHQRPDLREELARRLSLMDPTELGWTIDREATELVSVLGVDSLIRLARTIPAEEERILARVALVPFAPEAEKHVLVAEAVQAFRDPTGQESQYWSRLLLYWKWMCLPDLCYLLVNGSGSIAELSILQDISPFLKRFGGNDLPLKLAEQIVDVGRWAP